VALLKHCLCIACALLKHCACIAGPPGRCRFPASGFPLFNAVALVLPDRFQSGISAQSVITHRELGKDRWRERSPCKSLKRAHVVWQSLHDPLVAEQADVHAAL
jgi:hypothetical protein